MRENTGFQNRSGISIADNLWDNATISLKAICAKR